MSEQVGAGLVLAQMINPAGAAAPSANAPQAGSGLPKSSTETTKNATQPFVITEENSPTFASLLNELATLEVQDATGSAPLDDTLIRVRVDVQLDPDTSGAVAADLPPPGGGKPLPVDGNRDTDGGMILPLLPEPGPQTLQTEATVEPEPPPAVVPVRDAERRDAALAEEPIIVPESRRAGPTPQPAAEQPAAVEISRTATPPVTSSDRTIPESAPGSRPDGQSANSAVSGIAADADGAMEQDSDAGGRQSDQQAAARGSGAFPDRSSNAGPTISFSHDASGTATTATAMLGATSSASSAAAAGPAGVLPQTLTLSGAPETWARPLAERLAGIAARGMNTADVRLHPPSLGQLEIRITINNDQASIWLASPNADVREALQQALPRLDGLLNDLGIELAEAEVSDRQPQESGQDGGREETTAELTDTAEEPARPSTDSSRLGVLDTWA